LPHGLIPGCVYGWLHTFAFPRWLFVDCRLVTFPRWLLRFWLLRVWLILLVDVLRLRCGYVAVTVPVCYVWLRLRLHILPDYSGWLRCWTTFTFPVVVRLRLVTRVVVVTLRLPPRLRFDLIYIYTFTFDLRLLFVTFYIYVAFYTFTRVYHVAVDFVGCLDLRSHTIWLRLRCCYVVTFIYGCSLLRLPFVGWWILRYVYRLTFTFEFTFTFDLELPAYTFTLILHTVTVTTFPRCYYVLLLRLLRLRYVVRWFTVTLLPRIYHTFPFVTFTIWFTLHVTFTVTLLICSLRCILRTLPRLRLVILRFCCWFVPILRLRLIDLLLIYVTFTLRWLRRSPRWFTFTRPRCYFDICLHSRCSDLDCIAVGVTFVTLLLLILHVVVLRCWLRTLLRLIRWFTVVTVTLLRLHGYFTFTFTDLHTFGCLRYVCWSVYVLRLRLRFTVWFDLRLLLLDVIYVYGCYVTLLPLVHTHTVTRCRYVDLRCCLLHLFPFTLLLRLRLLLRCSLRYGCSRSHVVRCCCWITVVVTLLRTFTFTLLLIYVRSLRCCCCDCWFGYVTGPHVPHLRCYVTLVTLFVALIDLRVPVYVPHICSHVYAIYIYVVVTLRCSLLRFVVRCWFRWLRYRYVVDYVVTLPIYVVLVDLLRYVDYPVVTTFTLRWLICWFTRCVTGLRCYVTLHSPLLICCSRCCYGLICCCCYVVVTTVTLLLVGVGYRVLIYGCYILVTVVDLRLLILLRLRCYVCWLRLLVVHGDSHVTLQTFTLLRYVTLLFTIYRCWFVVVDVADVVIYLLICCCYGCCYHVVGCVWTLLLIARCCC